MMEALDAQILHALELSPRASFRRIAAAVDVSEQTVARRYHRLRRDGVMRVVGLINPRVHGDVQWVTRIHAKPDRMPQLADALVRRPEVFAGAISGRTNLMAIAICRDVDDLYRYLTEHLAAIDHVQMYDISIRTQRLKQSASLISHGRLVNPRRT